MKLCDEASEAYDCNDEWAQPEIYILIPQINDLGNGYRLLGTWELSFYLDEDGRPDQHEIITIYFTEYEQVTNFDKFYEIIVHENLHGLWCRLVMSEPGFYEANMDSEKWVRDRLNQEVPPIYYEMIEVM
jgi:hypothetical protein